MILPSSPHPRPLSPEEERATEVFGAVVWVTLPLIVLTVGYWAPVLIAVYAFGTIFSALKAARTTRHANGTQLDLSP